MGKISEIFNFDNIGEKIKNLAKWSCWITILLIWIATPITFIALVADEWTAHLWWVPLLSAIVGPVVVWIESWMIYAFGEFVEDIHAMRNKTATIDSIDRSLKVLSAQNRNSFKNEVKHEEKTAQEEPKQAKVDESALPVETQNSVGESSWICGKCKTKNLNVRNDCWSCGNPK